MRAALAWLLVLASVGAGRAAPTDSRVEEVTRELRCVVCQNLSVADSPSEMARQMREVVRERLAAGESPEAVKAYFVERYGEWVLLVPPTRGFPLLAWTLPGAVLLGGLAGALLVLKRWSRRSPGLANEPAVDEEDLAAVREELRRRGP